MNANWHRKHPMPPRPTHDHPRRLPLRESRYAFGTRTAEFHICSRCGIVPVVTSRIDGHLYAVVSVNAFEGVTESLVRRAPASFDGEGAGERLARRQRNWIADVTFR